MKPIILSHRYALAAYKEAQELGVVTTFKSEVESLLDIYENDYHLRNLISTSSIDSVDVLSFFNELCTRLSYTRVTQGLLTVLINNHRIKYLSSILNEILNIIREEAGEMIIKISHAGDLTDDMRDSIKEKLSKMTGKVIILTERRDNSLLSGIKLEIGDVLLDMSAKSQLKALERHLIK